MTSALADARTAYLTALADAAALELAAVLADAGRPGATVMVVEPDLNLRSVELIEVTFADGTTMGRDELDDHDIPLCIHQGFDNVETLGEWAANPALTNTEELRVPRDRTVRDAINGMRDAIDAAASLTDLIAATNAVIAALHAARTQGGGRSVGAALAAMDGWHADIDMSCGECFGHGGFDADGDATEFWDPEEDGSACPNCEGAQTDPDDDAVTPSTIEAFTARWEAVNAAYRDHAGTDPDTGQEEAYTPLHVADECDECGADITRTTDLQSWAHDRACSLYPANEVGYGEPFARLAGDVTAASAGWHGTRPTRLTVRADVAASEVGTGRGTFDVIAVKGPDYERAYRGHDWWLAVPADIADPTRQALTTAAGAMLADMAEGTFTFDLDVPPNDGDDDNRPAPDPDSPQGRLAVALAEEIERRTGERPVRVDVVAEITDDQVGSGAGDVFVLNYQLADGTTRAREETNGWASHTLADDSIAHVAEVLDATERFLIDLPVGVTPVRLDVPHDTTPNEPCGWCGTPGGATTLHANHPVDCAAREAFCRACDQIVRGTDWGHLPDAHTKDCTDPTDPMAGLCKCGGVEECECPPPKPCDHCHIEFDDHTAADRPAHGHDPLCPFTLATLADPLLAELAAGLAARATDGKAGRWARAIAAHADHLADHPVVMAHLVSMAAAAADLPPCTSRPAGLAGAVADRLIGRGVGPGHARAVCTGQAAWDRWLLPLLDSVQEWVDPLGGMPDAAVADAAVEAVKRTRGVNAKAARRLIGHLGGTHADDTMRRVVAAAVGPVTRHTVDDLLVHLLPDDWTVDGAGLRICIGPAEGPYRWAVDTRWAGTTGGDWSAATDLARDGDPVADVPTGLPADGGTHPVKAARRIAALTERV